jgi:primosomal protein N' (replication factor Y)
MNYADIIVDISHEKLDRDFQYRVPEQYKDKIRVGMVVKIPFGNANRERKGYVIALSDTPKFDVARMKEILELCSTEETTESRLIALAAWMKEQYGSTMIQALKTVLPVQKKVKGKEKYRICLNVSDKEAQTAADAWAGGRRKARARLLQLILSAEDRSLDYETATKELEVGVSVIKALEEDGYIRRESSDIYRVPADVQGIPREEEKPLSTAQQEAVDSILKEWAQSDPRPVLLHGVTGSGKTQVYMKLIEQVVASGKQAIVLIPEIALTYQTVRRFYGRFGDRVSVLNSRLSLGERYDQFRRAKAGEIQIMVGPRSALFTPFPELGLIVIDEEHEQTYKSEGSPRYHARETAIQRARMEGAQVILGSATPSIEAYEHAVRGDYALVRLEHRYGEQTLPIVSVVDLREELRQGNRSVLSRALKAAIEERLTRKEQVMLFLNRRGYAGFVSCRSCGHVMKCPHCDVSLSSHNNGKLVCHYCGYEQPDVKKCPECGSAYIGGFKAGTQQIEQILKKNFPGVRVLRMDYDTTRNKGSYEKILSAFAAHEADILVGTQMIVKGHDFPEVTLVGVLAADLSLNISDYRSAERTFQLLVQAVGRSGRAGKAGEAIIQTYHPDHYSIQAAVSQDYEAFFQEEISYRYLMDYPPGACMLSILASCEDDELLEKASEYLAKYIRRVYPGNDLHMIGPAYAAVGKVNDVYRRVIYLKHADRDILIRIRDQLEKYIEINSGFRKIYIQYDFN